MRRALIGVLFLTAARLPAQSVPSAVTTCDQELGRLGRVQCRTVVTPPPAPGAASTFGSGLAHALTEGLRGASDEAVLTPRSSEDVAYARVAPLILGRLRLGRAYLEALDAPPSLIRSYISAAAQAMYDAYTRTPSITVDGLSQINVTVLGRYEDAWRAQKAAQ